MSGLQQEMYLRPREKALQKGVSALSDRELVQLVVGSGTARYSVARIAKRVVSLLKRYGSAVDYDQLIALPGLGVARTTQLLALFELAGRYPVSVSSVVLDSPELLITHTQPVSGTSARLWLVMLDGGKRLIGQRTIPFDSATHTVIETLRLIVDQMIRDGAVHVALLRQVTADHTTPSMTDLAIARDTYRLGLLLGLQSVEYLIYTDTEHRSIMKEATYAA